MIGAPVFRYALTPGWAGDSLTRAAQAVPSLDLNFAATKNLGPLITFTRASSATYVGSDGLIKTATTNEPRFDHNPTAGESLGLLGEEQRTNLAPRSEEFDNASWIKYSANGPVAPVVTANQSTAPNGSVVADKIVLPAVSGAAARCILYQQLTLSASTTYAFSCYLEGDVGGEKVWIGQTNNTIFSSSQCNLTTNWQRFSLVFTTSGAGTYYITIGVDLLDGTQTATSAQTFYAWGAQLEAGSFPSSYIPTTTAAVTRSADVASITGANFSSWYRQDEGTVFVSAGVQDFTQTNFPRLFSIDRGDISSNFIAAVRGSGTRRLDYSVFADGIGQAVGLNNGTAPAANTTANGAWVYKANDFIGAVNGVLTNSDTSGSVPTLLTTFGVGMQGNATLHYNGTIKRLTFFPQRLPNSTLEAITR